MSRRKLCRLTPAQLRLLLGEINEQTEGGASVDCHPDYRPEVFCAGVPVQNHPLPSSSIRGYDFSETTLIVC